MTQMKKFTPLAITLMLAAAPAFAQVEGAGDPPPPPPQHGPGGPGGHGRFMDEADANKDGFLTKDELRAANEKRMDEMFTNVDTNKDGKLSKEEQQKGREAFRAKMQERMKQRKENNAEK